MASPIPKAHVPSSSAAPVGVPPEESPDPVTNSAQSSLARTHAGEETLMQLKADLAKKEEMAKAAADDVEEARGKLKRAENEQRAKKFVSDEVVAAAMRPEMITAELPGDTENRVRAHCTASLTIPPSTSSPEPSNASNDHVMDD